jgi:hypothetical protein
MHIAINRPSTVSVSLIQWWPSAQSKENAPSSSFAIRTSMRSCELNATEIHGVSHGIGSAGQTHTGHVERETDRRGGPTLVARSVNEVVTKPSAKCTAEELKIREESVTIFVHQR